MPDDGLDVLLAPLTNFLGVAPLTDSIAALERALEDCPAEDLKQRLADQDVTPALLEAALVARSRFGRINDLIHAAAIVIALPYLLEPGERLLRPSLASGNDPSRPFDVETDLRIAEFKFARWTGNDADRKRGLFKDLVHLAAADKPGRRAELYVLGERPRMFLTTTRSNAAWALNRQADKTRALFQARFGSLDVPIPDFVSGPAAHIEIIDLEQLLPQHFLQQSL